MFKLGIYITAFGVVCTAFPSDRIVGGNDTDIDLHPWQVSIQYYDSHICGGILISNQSVLTAARCVADSNSTNVTIRAGSTNRDSGGEIIDVDRIDVHPSFNFSTLDNDIAVVTLAAPVSIANASACSLPDEKDKIVPGSPVTLTGWGALSEVDYPPDILQTVTVPAIDDDACKIAYGEGVITENMFCAGDLEVGGRGACGGDVGGPATIDDICVGIISWGFGCATPEYPWLNVKISLYRSWISTIISS